MFEFAALEQGAAIQNLSLMASALGLGGFPHFAAHPYAWFEALQFTFEEPTLKYSETVGGGPLVDLALAITQTKDIRIPTAIGFDPKWGLLQPFCVNTKWRTMRDAVLGFAHDKFATTRGRLRDVDDTPWQSEFTSSVLADMRPYEGSPLEATIAYAEYIHKRYRMFPSHGGPFRTEQAFQAHHLELGFYEKYYKPEAITNHHRNHRKLWH
jgi:hypothetical protein